MPIGHLLDSQVEELRKAVLSSGLGDQFIWQERDGRWAGYVNGTVPTLVFKPDNFFFALEYHEAVDDPYGMYHDPGGHQVFFAPGRETPDEVRRQLNWTAVVGAFKAWLRYIAREKGITPPAPPPAPGRPDKTRPTGLPASTHPTRERVLGSTINQWIEQEAARRGPTWQVVGVVLGLVLAALALFLS